MTAPLPPDTDSTCGYEAIAEDFLRARSATGANLVQTWAERLPTKSDILDVGAGFGWPITERLIEAGHRVSAIEPSPRLAKAFQDRFPDVALSREPSQTSPFLNQTYGGIVAVGLIFLLPKDEQRELLQRMTRALKPGGHLLFSAPEPVCAWDDVLTGQRSSSLGFSTYRAVLKDAGCEWVRSNRDSGGNHFIEARKAGMSGDPDVKIAEM